MIFALGRTLALAGVLLIAPSAHALETGSSSFPAQGTLQVAFTPWDDVEALVHEVISAARQQVLVQAYLLTSKRITATLVAAHRRGVAVQVLADAGQHAKAAASTLPDLIIAGIPVRLETKYQHAHNKVIVIDASTADATVITGSFNFTWTAQHKNAENILIARKNSLLASRYRINWERHWLEAIPYKND